MVFLLAIIHAAKQSWTQLPYYNSIVDSAAFFLEAAESMQEEEEDGLKAAVLSFLLPRKHQFAQGTLQFHTEMIWQQLATTIVTHSCACQALPMCLFKNLS